MGKYNLTALRVRQTALRQKEAGKTHQIPKWINVVRDIPPAQVLVRNQQQQHQLVRQRVKTLPGASKPQVVFEVQEKRVKPKKASRMFLPTEIKYEEDLLRKEFFRDHPWELARPRVVLESTGKDYENYDWSRLQQPGKRLDGERYVYFPLPCCFQNECHPSIWYCRTLTTSCSLIIVSSSVSSGFLTMSPI